MKMAVIMRHKLMMRGLCHEVLKRKGNKALFSLRTHQKADDVEEAYSPLIANNLAVVCEVGRSEVSEAVGQMDLMQCDSFTTSSDMSLMKSACKIAGVISWNQAPSILISAS